MSGALAVLLAWSLFPLRPGAASGPLLEFVKGNLNAVRRARATRDAAAYEAAPAPEQSRYHLKEEEVAELFAVGTRKNDPRIYDEWCAWRARPGRDLLVDWPEHPDGSFRARTNSLGLADHEVDLEAALDLRVLAAGDSHTFGVCDQQETWPNQLETLLTAELPGCSLEVLNTGQGGYTFFNYLGVLEKFLSWDPDVFVLAVFSGNDFSELYSVARTFGDSDAWPMPPGRSELRDKGAAISVEACGQGFNSASMFSGQPAASEEAVRLSLDMVQRMDSICKQRGILFVLAVIPSPCWLDWSAAPVEFEQVREALELSPDVGLELTRMDASFLTGLAELGLTAIDLSVPFRALETPPYWRADFHMNATGHRVLAEQLKPQLLEWCQEHLSCQPARR